MRRLILLVVAGLAAAPSIAASPAYLDQLLRGKTAEASRRCIFPDLSARPQIIDGTALVYRDAHYTYVAHFKGGCPALREDRRIIVRGAGGQLCKNDPVRVSETTGHESGFCTFDGFVPYRKN